MQPKTRSVFLNAEPACVIALLLRPVFWFWLPFRFRTIQCDTPYLSIGSQIRPAMEVFHLIEIHPNQLVFQVGGAKLVLSTIPLDGGTALQSVVQTGKDAVLQADKLLNGIARLLAEKPHLKWLSKMALTATLDDQPAYLESTVRIAFDSEASAEDLEYQVVRNPLGYSNWLDPAIGRGNYSIDQSWPASGSAVRYSHRRELWWLTPWWNWTTTGEIELLEWDRGRHILLQDTTDPCGVTATWDFHYSPRANGTRIELVYAHRMRSASARKLLGRAISTATATETGLALCELAEVMAGSAQTTGVSS